MMLTALALVALLATPTANSAPLATPSAQEQVDVRAKFVELHAKNDEAGCESLWKQHPGEVLGAIDADLEGSLAAWEKNSAAPDVKAIAEQHARALWGAKLATQASGHPIFLDYASSFVGWTDEQKKDFRAGQKAYGRARSAMKAKDFAAAAAAGRECADLAAPLGDWWGLAMGLSAEGTALAAQGKPDEALAPLSQAALVYHDLGLIGDEYRTLRTLATALVEAKRPERAKAALARAIELADLVGDSNGRAALEAQLAKLVGEGK